jgi:glutaredoxin
MRPVEGSSERAIFVIDKDGIIRYIDIHDIDTQPDNEILRAVLRGLQGGPVVQTIYPPPVQQEEELPDGGVVLYCARWCKDCKRARAWLTDHNLEFVEVDIDYNLKARSQLRKWGNGALVTPAIDLCGTVVLDFKEDQLEEALRVAQQEGRL